MRAGAPPPRDLTPVARACGAFALLLGLVILTGWAIDVETVVAPRAVAAGGDAQLGSHVHCPGRGPGHRRRRARGVSTGSRGRPRLQAARDRAGGRDAVRARHRSCPRDRQPLGIEGSTAHPAARRRTPRVRSSCSGVACSPPAGADDTGNVVASVLGAGTATVVGLAVAGFLIGVSYLLGAESLHGMSVHTAVGLVVVLTGVFALRPDAPGILVRQCRRWGGSRSQSSWAPALILPFAAGALVQAGASLGWYGQRLGLSIMVVVVAGLIQALIFIAVSAVREHRAQEPQERRAVHVADRRRRSAFRDRRRRGDRLPQRALVGDRRHLGGRRTRRTQRAPPRGPRAGPGRVA